MKIDCDICDKKDLKGGYFMDGVNFCSVDCWEKYVDYIAVNGDGKTPPPKGFIK